MKTTEELANAAFDANEQVRMLGMMNTSHLSYEERKKQHAEYCLAQEAAHIADRELRQRIYSPPTQRQAEEPRSGDERSPQADHQPDTEDHDALAKVCP